MRYGLWVIVVHPLGPSTGRPVTADNALWTLAVVVTPLGSARAAVRPDNTLRTLATIVTPLGSARYRSRSDAGSVLFCPQGGRLMRYGRWAAGRPANALRPLAIVVTPLGPLGIVTAVSLRGAERRGNPFSKYCVFVDCLEINGTFRATPHNGARRFGGRFWPKRKYGKCGNTGCISHFSYCTIGAKDPLKPAAPT